MAVGVVGLNGVEGDGLSGGGGGTGVVDVGSIEGGIGRGIECRLGGGRSGGGIKDAADFVQGVLRDNVSDMCRRSGCQCQWHLHSSGRLVL